ncbi:MAG TPA: metalloregulator ArsR/SmtB family transcription factor [Chitinophagales bacterium]
MRLKGTPQIPKSLSIDNAEKEILSFVNPRTKHEIELNFNSLKRVQLTLRAVNHPLRKEMLQIIEQRKKVTVTELYTRLRIEQSLASQQLSLLRKAGTLETTRDGKFIYYSVNAKRLSEIARFVEALQQ